MRAFAITSRVFVEVGRRLVKTLVGARHPFELPMPIGRPKCVRIHGRGLPDVADHLRGGCGGRRLVEPFLVERSVQRGVQDGVFWPVGVGFQGWRAARRPMEVLKLVGQPLRRRG